MAQYLKQDSELGYIVDNADIEYSKFNNLRHVVLGCMLGDFDETGAYVVEKEIIQELISMPKYIVESMDNIEICQGELKLDKHVSFMVSFEGNKATLALIEKLNYEANFKLNSGVYSNIVETVLDEVETSGEVNRNVIYTKWNINPFGGNVIDIFSCDNSVLEKYFGIVNRFKYLLETNKTLLEKEEDIEEVEAYYSNEILNILKHYPKLEKEVLKQVKESLEKRQDTLSVNKPNFVKTFNEILDNAIQTNVNVLDEKEKVEFEKEKHNVVNDTNIKKQEIVDVESIKNDAEKESPNLIRIKTSPVINSKSIDELSKDFAEINNKVSERLNKNADEEVDVTLKPENVKGKKHETEKNKLFNTLVGIGIGAAVAGIPGAVVGGLVAEATNAVAEAVKGKNQTKDPVKKSENGNTKSGGKGNGKGGSNGKGATKNKKTTKEEKVNPKAAAKTTTSITSNTIENFSGRLFPNMVALNTENSNTSVKGAVVVNGEVVFTKKGNVDIEKKSAPIQTSGDNDVTAADSAAVETNTTML